MNTLDFARQYANLELCQKWNNNIPLSELQGSGFILALDAQEIHYARVDIFPFLPEGDITGIIYRVGDGDFDEVYVTESSRPYALNAIYHPLEYYI